MPMGQERVDSGSVGPAGRRRSQACGTGQSPSNQTVANVDFGSRAASSHRGTIRRLAASASWLPPILRNSSSDSHSLR